MIPISERSRDIALMWEISSGLSIGGAAGFTAEEIAYRLGMEPPVLYEDGLPDTTWIQVAYDLYLRGDGNG
jgi:hypothetical protein